MWADLHDALLYERRRVVDQDEKSLWLDEFVHHLLQQEVRQQEQNSSQQIIQTTADQNQTVFSTGPEWFRKHTHMNHHGEEEEHQIFSCDSISQNTQHVKYQNKFPPLNCYKNNYNVPMAEITHTVISVQTKGKSIFDRLG